MSNQNGPQEQTRQHVTLWVYDKAQQVEIPLTFNSEAQGVPVSLPADVVADIDTIAANSTLIAADMDAIATDLDTINTSVASIAVDVDTIATQTTNINNKLPTLDANSRFKVSNVTSWVYGGIVQLGTSTASIVPVTSRAAVKIIFANVDTSARTFQYGFSDPLTDATSVEKNHPLSAGEPYEVILDGLASTTVYGLCSSANTVNATYWTALL